MYCIHPFHSSVCSRPNSTMRGVVAVVAVADVAADVDAVLLVVLAFHVLCLSLC